MNARTDTVDIATGGDPLRVVAAALAELRPRDGRVYRLSIAHDSDCPCIARGLSMKSCTCEIVRITRSRVR